MQSASLATPQSSPLPNSRTSSVRDWLRPAIQWTLAAGIAVSMAVAGRKLIASSNLQWSHLSWGMAIALTLAIVYRIVNAYGWSLVLRAMGLPVDGGQATRVWLISESRRWLPGSIWGYVSRASMAQRLGVPVSICTASMLLELALVIAAAGLTVIPAMILCSDRLLESARTLDLRWAWGLLAVVALAGLGVLLGGHRILAKKWAQFQSKWAALRTTPVRMDRVLMAGLYFLAMSVLNGLITWIVAVTVVPASTDAYSFSTAVPLLAILAATAGSWLAGFFAICSPGGLVVREAAFAAMLLPWLPYSESLTIAVIARVLQFVAEAVVIVWIAVENYRNSSRARA